MGNYLTTAVLRDYFEDSDAIESLTDSTDTTEQNERLEREIAAAEGWINSWIGKRYEVPVVISVDAELGRMLTSGTASIALQGLYSKRNKRCPEDLRDEAKEWRELFKEASKPDGPELPSAVALPLNDTAPARFMYGSSDSNDDMGRIFTRDNQYNA